MASVGGQAPRNVSVWCGRRRREARGLQRVDRGRRSGLVAGVAAFSRVENTPRGLEVGGARDHRGASELLAWRPGVLESTLCAAWTASTDVHSQQHGWSPHGSCGHESRHSWAGFSARL